MGPMLGVSLLPFFCIQETPIQLFSSTHRFIQNQSCGKNSKLCVAPIFHLHQWLGSNTCWAHLLFSGEDNGTGHRMAGAGPVTVKCLGPWLHITCQILHVPQVLEDLFGHTLQIVLSEVYSIIICMLALLLQCDIWLTSWFWWKRSTVMSALASCTH